MRALPFSGAFVALASVAFLAGCTLPQALPESSSLTPPAGKLLVVGKIVLDPPFDAELEQETHWNIIGDGAIRNRVLIATHDTPREIRMGQPDSKDWQGYIDAHWGEYFVAELPQADRYLNAVLVPLNVRAQDYLWFPGGLALRPPDSGELLYVGTLRYVRNDFNEILDIEVLNERAEALDALEQRFGRRPAELKDSLWLRQLPWEAGE